MAARGEKPMAVDNAGGTPELLAPKEGEIQVFNHLDKSSAYPVDQTPRCRP